MAKLTADNNLAAVNPELAAQLHPSLNGELTPEGVTCGSDKKVWWRCDEGHEWEAKIWQRSSGQGCLACRSIAVTHPELMAQWHPSKNNNLSPQQVTYGSSKKAWWQCGKGHEWEATIYHRSCGHGCHVCSGQKVSEDNNLAVVNPELAKQWSPLGNGDLTPADVMPRSNKKAWWQCEQGHEWEATIANRSQGRGCPFCSNRLAGEYNNLSVANIGLALQWHPTLNKDSTPQQFTPGSNKKVWWQCDKGHEWEATIYQRSCGQGCLACNSIATTHPDLVGQWHPSKNEDLTPQHVTHGSNKKVWWQCSKGHEWEIAVNKRSDRGFGCPFCSGKQVSEDNNLAAVNSDLAAQWHKSRNNALAAQHVSPGSGKKFWWQCEKGHEWEASPNGRRAGGGCPFCAGRRAGEDNNLAAVNPELAEQWDYTLNKDLTPQHVTAGSNKKVWWRCDKDHQWESTVSNRSSGNGCPLCSEYGFKTDLPSIVYLLAKSDGVIKIGITGAGKVSRLRLAEHRKNGYDDVLQTWDLEEGRQAVALEKLVLAYWRKSLQLPPAAPQGEDGWTETVQSTPDLVKKTIELVQSQIEN